MNRKVLVAGLALVVPLLVVLFANLGRNPGQIDSPLIGQPAPPFSLVPVGGGEPITLEQFRGRPVVLNFWATWCVPCYQEHDVLVRGARSLGSDVQFLGVVYEDEEANVRSFLQQQGSSYPSLVDPDGKTAIAYGVYGVPETFFVDGAGSVTTKHVGPLDPDRLAANLRASMRGVQASEAGAQ